MDDEIKEEFDKLHQDLQDTEARLAEELAKLKKKNGCPK